MTASRSSYAKEIAGEPMAKRIGQHGNHSSGAVRDDDLDTRLATNLRDFFTLPDITPDEVGRAMQTPEGALELARELRNLHAKVMHFRRVNKALLTLKSEVTPCERSLRKPPPTGGRHRP